MADEQEQVEVAQAETRVESEAPKWGELPDEGCQRVLDGYLQAWDELDADEQELRLAEREGPLAKVALSGADVFYLAIATIASVPSEEPGTGGDRAEAERQLRAARDASGSTGSLARSILALPRFC